jgi:DNA-binding FadR family transcriptional regulator
LAVLAPKVDEATSLRAQRLVQTTAEKLRDLILAAEPDALVGSLPELAKLFGVGIATVQQAARVLEHEGLLEVRRGPGGGYFGRRPDVTSIERSLATFLRGRRADDYEALEMMTLLDCELVLAAAREATPILLDEMRKLRDRIDFCLTTETRIALEDDLHSILFRMVDRPLMELLARVSMQFYRSRPIPLIFEGEEGLNAWRRWRHHVIGAIVEQDPDRARFEAERHRRDLLRRLKRVRDGAPA